MFPIIDHTSPKLPVDVQRAVLYVEGSNYTNNPIDPGGPTKYGWSLRTYKSLVDPTATKYQIRHLSKDKALYLYKKYFWDIYGADKIQNNKLRNTLFLAQINIGPYRPNKLLQEMTNEFCPYYMKKGRKYYYKQLNIDGILGSHSLYRINKCKYLWPGYPYVLYHLYSSSQTIRPVWKWAKMGLMTRIFYELKGKHHEI